MNYKRAAFFGQDLDWHDIKTYVLLYCEMHPLGYDVADRLHSNLLAMMDYFYDKQLLDLLDQLRTDLDPLQNTEPVHHFLF